MILEKLKDMNKDNSLVFIGIGVILTIISFFIVPLGIAAGLIILNYTIGMFIDINIQIIILGITFVAYILVGGIIYILSNRMSKVKIKDWKDLANKMIPISLIVGIAMLIITGYVASIYTGALFSNGKLQTIKCPGFDDCNSRWAANLNECPIPTEKDKTFNSPNLFSSEYNCSISCNIPGCAVENITNNTCQLINFCAFLRQYFVYYGPHNPLTLFLGAYLAWRFLKW